MAEESQTRYEGVSVTIKFGTDKDAPWVVFHGTMPQVRKQIIESFAFGEDGAEWTDAELVTQATKAAGGLMAATSGLGGTPVSRRSSGAYAAARAQQTAPPAEPEPELTLAQKIEACASVPDLQALWVENSAAIQSEGLVDAWKAKGKALTAA
jgi:hypothetical protein